MAFLDPTAIARLESMQLRARTIVEGALSGMHRATLHGSSIEFAQHKEYAAGDEIRHLDWKAYGKLDRYYIKQYEQESELSSYLVVDATGSMDYRGDGISKLSYAAYLAGALAYVLIRQRDKVGLVVYGGVEKSGVPRVRYIPPRARATHLHDLLAVLEDLERDGAGGDTDLETALRQVAEYARGRRSQIIVLSDLLDRSDGLGVLTRLRARRHDVALFHLLDPHELELPFAGLTVFESLEQPDNRMLVDPGSVRREYRRQLRAFVDGARETCVNGGVEYRQVRTDRPFEETVLDFLTQRVGAAGDLPEATWNS